MRKKKLRLRQLDRKLEKARSLKSLQTPAKGWISEIRRALGMSGVQLAARLGVSKSAVGQYDKGEVDGTLTLGTLGKAADALECDLLYALIPRTNLEEQRERQAGLVAQQMVATVAHSMRLEEQGVSDEEHKRQVEDLARQLLDQDSRLLWD